MHWSVNWVTEGDGPELNFRGFITFPLLLVEYRSRPWCEHLYEQVLRKCGRSLVEIKSIRPGH